VVLHISDSMCYVRRRKRVEDDRAKVAEEEARVRELRARSRVQERKGWRAYRRGRFGNGQGTMDGGRIPISHPKKKRRRKRLQKHNGLESGGGGVVSFFSVASPSSLAQMLRRVLVQLHRRPWWHEMRNRPLQGSPLQQLLALRL
jgi:hypothetical protein